MMKKILIVTPQLGGVGGIETVLLKILHSSLTKKFKFKLLILGGIKKNRDRFENIKKVDIDVTSGSTKFFRAIDMVKYILSNNLDIVICLSREELMVAFYVRKIFKLKFRIISWPHFSLHNDKTNFKKYADYCLSISSGNTNELNKRGISSENIFTVYNPISINNYIINKPLKKIRFVYVGRILFGGQKNLKELIDGIATWHRKDWLMSFFGTGPDIAKCKEYIHKQYPQIENQFEWNGWYKDPWNKIKSANALILTSKIEGLPMVLLEAMSRGLPCISSNCKTGPNDIIENGVNGYLYNLGDLRSFHGSLDNVIMMESSPSEIKESIGKFRDKVYFYSLRKILLKI